jgi:S-DNA-T family DNA segregation ATPase FtsK/SpoIIIE
LGRSSGFSGDTPAVREEAVEKLARLARRGPAAGFILNAASQRPDTESVPTKLREIITYRYCTQVVDRTSFDMVLGKGKAGEGADASILSEDHKGVGVLVTGPGSFEIVRCDYMDLPTFATLCTHGRALRVAAGTLSGDAATDTVAVAEAAGIEIPGVLVDVLYAMHGVERMYTATLLARLTNIDEDTYAGFTPERLAEELEHAGVQRSGRQVKVPPHPAFRADPTHPALPSTETGRLHPPSGGQRSRPNSRTAQTPRTTPPHPGHSHRGETHTQPRTSPPLN